jgi:hypothetical protein
MKCLPFWIGVGTAHLALVALRLELMSLLDGAWPSVALVAVGAAGQVAIAVAATVLAFRADATVPRRQVAAMLLRIALVFAGTFLAALLAGGLLGAAVLTALGRETSERGQGGAFFFASVLAWVAAIAAAPRGAAAWRRTATHADPAAARRGRRFAAIASVASFAMPLPLEVLSTFAFLVAPLAVVAATAAGVLGAAGQVAPRAPEGDAAPPA